MSKKNGASPQEGEARISTEKAREVLTRAEQIRIERTQKDIEAILQRDRTALDVFVILRRGSIEPQINIIALR